MPSIRRCSKCRRLKPLDADHFNRHPSSRYGFRPDCRPCCAKRLRVWYKANRKTQLRARRFDRKKHPEKYKAWSRASYLRNRVARIAASRAYAKRNHDRLTKTRRRWVERNRVRLTAYFRSYYLARRRSKIAAARRWYKANQARALAYRRRYHQMNREAALERVRLWQRRNPERARILKRLKEARRRRWRVQGERISSVDIQILYRKQHGRCAYCHKQLRKRFHLDHIRPLAKNGRHALSNLCCACPRCNIRKGVRPADFVRITPAPRHHRSVH